MSSLLAGGKGACSGVDEDIMVPMPRLVPAVVAAGAMRQMDQPVLECDPEIEIRSWRADDVEAVVAAYSDPDIRQWNLQALDATEAADWIGQWTRKWQAETDACWAIAARSSQAVLGRVALRSIRLDEGNAEVTYWVLPLARNVGVATMATEQVCRWALQELGLHRVELFHSVLNAPSCRVAERAGFALEGTLRSALLHPDGWHDMHLHAILGE